LTVLISLIMTLTLILRDPWIQTLTVQLAADYLSREMGTKIRVGSFDLSIRNGLIIKNICVNDTHDTTLFSAQELGVKPRWFSLSGRKIGVQKIMISQGEFQLIKHRGDTLLNLEYIINHFASSDTTPQTPDTTTSAPWTVSCSHLVLNGIRFHYQDEDEPLVTDGMDYANIDVRDIHLDMTAIRVKWDTINATINSLSANERSGIHLKEFRGKCRVCSHSVEVTSLKLRTDHSDLSLDFAMRYRAFISFTDFLKLVRIEAAIRPSEFDMTDIGFFAPEIKTMTNRFRIQGTVNGTVSKFKAQNMRFAFGENTLFNGTVHAVGLPDIMSTYIDMEINSMSSTAKDIRSFRLPGDTGTLVIPSQIDNLGLINIKGQFTGFVDDFVANAEIRTDIGTALTNLDLKKKRKGDPIAYKGDLRIGSFDLGKLTSNRDLLGKVTLKATLDGHGFTFRDADLLMQVMIDSAFFYGYNYKEISVNGSLIRKKFFGDVTVTDPNLSLSFHGMADLRDTLPVFNFKSHIAHAQLFNLNLLQRDSVELFAAMIDADFKGDHVDNAEGSLWLHDISYWEGEKVARLDSLVITSDEVTQGEKSYSILSDLLDANFKGHFAFSALVPSLVNFIQNYLASFTLKQDSAMEYTLSGQELNYRIDFKNTDEVTSIFIPFLRIAPGSYLEGTYSEEGKMISLNGWSSLLNVSGLDLEEWKIHAETRSEVLSLQTGCDHLIMDRSGPKDTIYLQMDTLLLTAAMQHDSILCRLSSETVEDTSYLKGFLTFLDPGGIKIKLEELDLDLAGNRWSVSEDNYVILDSSDIEFHNLSFSTTHQLLSLDGRITHHNVDTLNLKFNGVNVSELDHLIGNPDIDIDGILSGTFKITDIYHEFSLYSDLRLDGFSFNKQPLGDAVFQVNYDRNADKFNILSEIIYTGNIGQNIPFYLEGSLYTGTSTPYFDVDLKLKNLNLKMLYPFVSGFLSKLTGLVSGEVNITGNFKEPSMKGQINLMRTEFNISYLNVPYSVSDVILIEPGRFAFQDMVLYDSLGNKAYLNGSITHNYFKDLNLNLNIRMTDFAAFRNTYAQNSTFYGKARASGTVEIKGPLDNILISVNASTGKQTSITIPISLTQNVSQVDYIVFVQPEEDSLDVPKKKPNPSSSSGLNLMMSLEVKPDAQVEVIFPDQLGNIKATGLGNLSMGITPTTPFNLYGSYIISKGSFLFQMKNLIRMPFAIKEGGSISWNGDPTDANISLSAIYKTKVPLSGLSAETSTVQGRIPVECIIRLNGKLMNPILSFGMALPNAQENEKNLVYNAIDTNNAAEMTQQVLYIMVMNQFKPVAGGTDPTIDVGSTSLSIVTNQISSWLSGMAQHLNIGVNYQPGTTTTGQEIDMTVSTQLFDDRLLIDGTFGMSSYKNTTSAQASTIVGDINIEYVLTKNRRWRLRAFNRTNTIDILNNNAPYTQGVGISYQRDFSHWGDLFRRPEPKGLKKQ